MNFFEKIGRKKVLLVFVHLDDILVLAHTEKRMQKDLDIVVSTLLQAGFKINTKKSTLFPCKQVNHLGMLLDFATGKVEVPPKVENYTEGTWKVAKGILSHLQKSGQHFGPSQELFGGPSFLMLVTDQLLDFTSLNRQGGWTNDCSFRRNSRHKSENWKHTCTLGLEEIFQKELKGICTPTALSWPGGAGHVYGKIGAEFWREKKTLHINYKELEAAVATIKSLANPGEVVELCVDNTVAYSYLKNGEERSKG